MYITRHYMMKNTRDNIIPIDRLDKSERCALVPGYHHKKPVRRLKELGRARGNCYFARGVPKGLCDFIYRCVVKLKLSDKDLLFSRGQVKKNGVPVLNAVGVSELDWDCGISIKIPALLRYSTTVSLTVEGVDYNLRLMEIIVLRALLQIARPGKNPSKYPDMAAYILARGWPRFDMNKSPEVSRKK